MGKNNLHGSHVVLNESEWFIIHGQLKNCIYAKRMKYRKYGDSGIDYVAFCWESVGIWSFDSWNTFC